MNPISLCLNLLLATLLLAALLLGRRLDRRLRALKDGHEGFASAVADLDRAAARAERGLADLRAATDESVEFLSGRIEKGRELAAKLERLTAVAAASADRAPPPSQISALERVWAKPANEQAPIPPTDPEAAAESLVLKLSEALNAGDPASRRLSLRSRAILDDDLFDSPARPARAGGGAR